MVCSLPIMPAQSARIDLSYVIPVCNEEQTLASLAEGIAAHTPPAMTFEILFIDDGSTDGSWSQIQALTTRIPQVCGIRLVTNYGKSAALAYGLSRIRGRVVVTMDSDLQDDPADIPRFLEKMASGSYDLVCGWRRRRNDPLEKRAASALFNAIVRWATGVQLHDMNIGFKCFSREVAKSLRLYSDMHRFVPVLARDAGFRRLGEIEVSHRPRQHGQSKYGWERYRRGMFDLLTVLFLSHCRGRPMQFLGPVGLILILVALVMAVAAGYVGTAATPWGGLWLGGVALVFGLTGLQCGLLGLVGELVVAHGINPAEQCIVAEQVGNNVDDV